MGRRLNRDGRKFQKLAIGVLCSVGYSIYQCQKCSYPVLEGYVCGFCDCDDPVAAGDEAVDITV